ncbi:glycine zipper 2TM domain-containing protein [Roseateles puraquae]|uniref:Glycine zipper 2TM domain-containing protein n=1 Tax=Roseateles puraquae TaxID=431059 RepID=A0A254N6Y8_9BURK|nr:glycine zipper 2TM domain-containing protein [Roseateles puraquae]OWR02147.1 hypothetical protein CDO81_20615 [Roseateles puraquae]
MSSSPATVKSVQIVAGVAVVMALLGGAYAVGRSQQAVTAPTVEPVTAQAPVEPEVPAPTKAQVQPQPQTQRLASAQPVRETSRAPVAESREAAPALCNGCARVTDIHTETRRGQSSGVGAVGGAVVGGLLGNMVGGGNGRKLATVAGAVGGGYAGNEIEKNQKSYTVWVIQMREADGRLRRFERSADPGLRVGDEVLLTEQGFTRR